MMDEKQLKMSIEYDQCNIDDLATWTADQLDVEISRMRRRLAIFEAVRNSLPKPKRTRKRRKQKESKNEEIIGIPADAVKFPGEPTWNPK